MKKHCYFLWIAFLLTLSAIAQPSLDYKRIRNDFPRIELYMQAKCGAIPRYDLAKENFSLKENGIPIDSFTLSCPNPSVVCCASVASVIDRSGSMGWGSSNGIAGAQAGNRAFISAMDTCDELSIITFATFVTVDITMTNKKDTLRKVIDAIQTQGSTAVWDATIFGLNEVITHGSKTCRAVIVMTDGMDNASTRKPPEIISLALKNRIPIFTIGLGTSIDEEDLRRIADTTGGKFFLAPNPSQLIQIYQEISKIIREGFQECVLTYNSGCMDGTKRDVELTLKSVPDCMGNGVTAIKSFVAPRDTTTFIPLRISLGQSVATGGETIQIPLTLDSNIHTEFPRSTFTILYDDACVHLERFVTQGMLLDNIDFTVTRIAGGIQIETKSGKMLQSSGVLAMLTFLASDPQSDVTCPITLQSWKFSSGCFNPSLTSGAITIEARAPKFSNQLSLSDGITLDSSQRGYSPKTFFAELMITNTGNREAVNGNATLLIDPKDFRLVNPTSANQAITPTTLAVGASATVRWEIEPVKRRRGDSISLCISQKFENSTEQITCAKVWIPGIDSDFGSCAVIVPTIELDGTETRYIPMPFTVTLETVNSGVVTSDSLFATIFFERDLMFHQAEQKRQIKPMTPTIAKPGEKISASWTLIHPVSVDSLAYRMKICFREKGGDSTCCEATLTIPPLAGPMLQCYTLPPIKLRFDSTQKKFVPDPIHLEVSVANRSPISADSVRATIILPIGFSLAKTSEPIRKTFNPSHIEPWRQATPLNKLAWGVTYSGAPRAETNYCIEYTLERMLANGEMTQAAICAQCIIVPALLPRLTFECDAPTNLELNAERTRLAPNPFTVSQTIRNLGFGMATVKQSTLNISAVTGDMDAVQILSPNPVLHNRALQPGDAVRASFDVWTPMRKYERILQCDITTVDDAGKIETCSKFITIPAVDSLVSIQPEKNIPADFVLSQNYPNPFSESTTILLPLLLGEGWGEVKDSPMRSEVVAFKFYDLFGREVLDLSDEARSNSSVTIRASQLPGAGMYFYRLTANGISQTKIMVSQ